MSLSLFLSFTTFSLSHAHSHYLFLSFSPLTDTLKRDLVPLGLGQRELAVQLHLNGVECAHLEEGVRECARE